MIKGKEKVMSSIKDFNYISKYFGNMVDRQVNEDDYLSSIVCSKLLHVDIFNNRKLLSRLDKSLEIGDSYCDDFKYIFRKRNFRKNSYTASNQIIDTLAEIKAVEILHQKGFSEIRRIKERPDYQTVDFTASFQQNNYAIEVIRLNKPNSEKKKPQPILKKTYNCAKVYEFNDEELYSKLKYTIETAIMNKHSQMGDFFSHTNISYKGIIFISTGWDFFLNSYMSFYEVFMRDTKRELRNIFIDIVTSNKYPYINHLILSAGRNEDYGDNILIYPEIVKEQT